MIDDEGDKLGIDDTEKTFLNWWWRHIWFTVYPLSTGLIFASYLSGVNLYWIAIFNIPIFAAQILIGVYWGLKKIQTGGTSKSTVNPWLLVYELLPIIVALSGNIIFGIPLYITLLFAIVLIFLQNEQSYSVGEIPETFREGFSFDLLLAAYGIMLFKGIIERGGALPPVIEALGSHVPVLLVVILAGYAIGAVFGHLPGAIGVGFPVLLPFLPVISVRTVSLTFIFIFLGYFTSPIHLCIILTIEYFDIDMKRFYKRMLIPTAVLVAAVMIWFLVTGAFFMFF